MLNRGPVLLLSLFAGGCGVGDDGTTDLPMTPEPRICAANLSITGTYTLGAVVPDEVNNETGDPPGDGMPDVMGCWPTGTWSWTMALVDNTCATPPDLSGSHSFTVDYLPDPDGGQPAYNYTLVTPTVTNHRVKVSSGGGGLCEGVVELFSDDGLITWNLHPVLSVFNTDGPLTGTGEYAEWMDSQYP